MFGTRRTQSFGGGNSQFDDGGENNYDGYQKSSWRTGGYDESPPRGQGGGGSRGSGGGGMRPSSEGGRDFGGSSRSRGQGRGSPGFSRGRGSGTSGYGRGSSSSSGGGTSGYGRGGSGGGSSGYSRGGSGGGTSGYGRGSSGGNQSRGSVGGGYGRGNSSSSGGGGGPNRGYSTGTGEWGSSSGTTSHAVSLLSRAQEMGLTGEWSSMSRGNTEDHSMGSSGNWNMEDNSSSGNYNSKSTPGGWHGASNRDFNTGSGGGHELTLSAAVNEMSAGNWDLGSNRGHGSTGGMKDRHPRQSDDWSMGQSRGRGTSRGRDRDTSGDRDTGRSGGWHSGPSRGRGVGSSRGRDVVPSSRDTGPGKGYGGRGSTGYSASRDVDSVGSRGMGSSERYGVGSERGGTSGRGGYDREPREEASITEKAMDILKAVLGPQGYNAESLTQEFPPSKRRRTDHEGDDDDYRRGPPARNNRGRGQSRWGSSSYSERFTEESDNNRWGQQNKRHDRPQEENRWGAQSRNTRHDEDHGESQWVSQSHNEHFDRGFNQERWGQKSQGRNEDDFQCEQETHDSWREGGRNQNQWGSQSRNDRQVREQKGGRWGPQSQSDFHGEQEEQKWKPKSYNQDYDDENDHQQWGSRSYDEPPEKRRKPLLGPYPDYEKPKPKSLLGPYPDNEKPKPKAKPLLGPYPGHDKPKPLLGPYPGHDRPKPKSLLGPYPGHKRGDDDYHWEASSSRSGMRGRGARGGRSTRARGSRDRRYMESYEQESMGYEEPQPLLQQTFEDDYEPYPHHEQLHEYQESGWYDDSGEWGPYDQYEEGGEEYWNPSSYGDSWQFGEHAWQYGDQQVDQYSLQSGGYQPQRLSVRDRLGAKRPALLGAAPSVDLVKQLLTPEERKRLCKKYGSLPLEALFCHMCNQTKFSSIDSYLMHQIGKKHVAMTRSFHAKSNTTYQLLKSDVQLALKRDRSVANVSTDGYCPTCDVPKWGNEHHMGISANLLLHRFVKPFCCNQRFSSRLQYENHRLSLKHLQNEYKKKQSSEARFKKRLSDLKDELKQEGMEDEVTKIDEEEKRIEKVFTLNERIKELCTVMVPKMNVLAKEKMPEKIMKLKIAREINLRTKKPIKNSVQFVPFDPAEQVGVGNMIISTHYRCSLCSKSIDPDKESVIEHCKSEEHYNNAVLKSEELKNTETNKEEEEKTKEEEDDANEGGDNEGGDNEDDVDAGDDEPMEDPYEGESGDISTLMNEVEEMIGNEDEEIGEGGDEKLPEGFEDNDELIYDDADIAEEFRDVLDYNPDDMEEELSCEEGDEERKGTGKGRGTGRGAKTAPKKDKPAAKASPATRKLKRKI